MGQTIGVNVAKRAYDVNISQQFDGYSGVRIYVGTDDDGNAVVYEAGDTTGRTLEIKNDFGTQQMAEDILEDIQGYQYQPLVASNALLDPAAEMGDGVTVNGVYSGVFVRATTFGRLMASDISAPTDEEIAHEYSVDTAATDRAFSRFVKSTRAAISINATEISAEVERATTEEESLSSRITINAESITSEVTRATEVESSLSTRITQNANSIFAEVTRATKAEGTLSSNITATAESIKSTVAASGVWDSDGYSISVNGYGTPTANNIAASAHKDQYYLDKSSGRLWLSNGTKWSAVKYLTSIQSSLHQTADSISAQVTAQGNTKLDKTFTNSSFGWNLTSTSFSINANSSQNIFYADKSGIKIRGNAEVTGKITATSGYIGGSSGFTINATAIYNGKSSLTADKAGVYIGTNGIALGSLASDKTHSKFQVDSAGNLYAQSGTFAGSVYAKNIQSGGTYGYFNGSGIADSSISGSSKIAQYSVTGGQYGNLATSTVAYGNTAFTGTLDQVGVNKSNIAAINGYFTGTANFNYAIIQVLQAKAATLGGHSLYYSEGYVRYTE